MGINLHIERLVLDGIDISSGQNEVIQAKVSSELRRLLSSDGIVSNFSNGASFKSISAASIQINDTKPQTLGQQIAQSVYRGISHE